MLVSDEHLKELILKTGLITRERFIEISGLGRDFNRHHAFSGGWSQDGQGSSEAFEV